MHSQGYLYYVAGDNQNSILRHLLKNLNSAKAKILLAVSAILFASLLATTGDLYRFQKHALNRDAIAEITELSGIIKTGLKFQMLARNTELTQSLIDEIEPYAINTCIINREGVVKFSSRHEQIGTKLSKSMAQCQLCHQNLSQVKKLIIETEDEMGNPVLRSVSPIYNEKPCFACHPPSDKILGVLFVDHPTTETDATIAATLGRLLFTAIITFLLISIAIILSTNRWLQKPIRLLIEGANEIRKGNYGHKICYQTNTEFKTLAQAFNEMSSSIYNNVKTIENKNFELSLLCTIVKRISETMNILELKIIVLDLLLSMGTSDTCFIITPLSDGDTFEIVEKKRGKNHHISIVKMSETPPVTDERTTQLLAWIQKWTDSPSNTPELSPDTRSILLPLSIHDYQLGLIIITKETGYPFKQISFGFLSSVKEHLSIAFEHTRLYSMAVTDGLTGLFTIRYFQTQLERELSQFTRYGQKFSVLMLDIDHFKTVNDRYGHLSGDTVLKEVASIINNSLREIDIPCRYGGEEFALILPKADESASRTVAERIRKNIEDRRMELEGGVITSVTISIGGASCPQHGTVIRDIVSAADKALYSAKEEGRNRFVWYGQIQELR